MDGLHLVGEGMASDEYLTHEQRRNEPTIEPGQIWVVECEAASLSAFHAELLTRANVVLYERVLAGGGGRGVADRCLCRTAARDPATGPAIARRALEFAADGWSVLQLVERRVGWRQLLRSVAEDRNRRGASAIRRCWRSGRSGPAGIDTAATPRKNLPIVAAELLPMNCSA